MIRLRGRVFARKPVRSWFGWPVPADPRIVSRDELANLISTAEQRGFSRKAKDLRPLAQGIFAVLPYLYEGSPEASWICMVIQISDWTPQNDLWPEIAFGRLDIALADFDSLRRAKRSQRDQLLHWTAWLAFHPRAVPPNGAEPGGAESD